MSKTVATVGLGVEGGCSSYSAPAIAVVGHVGPGMARSDLFQEKP